MSKLSSQDIELFRVGDYGDKGVFTPADLDQMVANFQSGKHDVPFVVGHPEATAPAFGWLASMRRRDDGVLVGTAKEVNPAFEEMVRDGAFKKRSVELRKRTDGWTVTHVGWLGAKAPEVKGLADCKFEQGDAEVHAIFEEDVMAVDTEKTVAEQVRAFFAETFGSGKVASPVTFSADDVRRIATDTANAAVAAAVKPLEDQIKAQSATFAERDTQLATAETSARAEAAVTRLKTAGKWLPAFAAMGLPVVFAELAKATDTVTFGEGAAQKTATPLDTLVAFMESLPKIVPSGEVYRGQQAAATTRATSGVNDSPRTPADPNSVALTQFAETLARDHKLNFDAALTRAIAEHPELAIPGGAASGAV